VNPFGFAQFVFPGINAALAEQQLRGPRTTSHSLKEDYDRSEYRSFTNISTFHVSDNYLVKAILGYRAFRAQSTNDVDGTPFPIIDYDVSNGFQTGTNGPPSTRQLSAELQIQGKSLGDQLSWIAGLYADRTRPWPSDT